MALTRKLLKGMGLTDEQVDTIIEAHTDTVDGLKEDINKYKGDAEKLPDVQKELNELKAAGDGGYKQKFEDEHKAFEDYKKAQTEKELSYLNTVMLFINQANEISDFKDLEEELIREGLLPKPKFKPKTVEESPYRVFEYNGYVIKCGKNNVQNDRLTQRAFKEDMWLHTKGFHSSHVIIETKGEEIPNKVIEVASEICAFYSDAKQGSKVPVDYCFKKFVKKPSQAKPGSVIYTDYKTCYVNPNEHSELKR